ncbi:hypothetical protein AX16_004052 [Volvariella volvacea WC 439]|nr:hypothetical protein AX16_004052 [Volvariella volvacea WC 439]
MTTVTAEPSTKRTVLWYYFLIDKELVESYHPGTSSVPEGTPDSPNGTNAFKFTISFPTSQTDQANPGTKIAHHLSHGKCPRGPHAFTHIHPALHCDFQSIILAIIPSISSITLHERMNAIGETSQSLAHLNLIVLLANFLHIGIYMVGKYAALDSPHISPLVAVNGCMALEVFACGAWISGWVLLASNYFEWKYVALKYVWVGWYGVIVLAMVMFTVVVVVHLRSSRLGWFKPLAILGVPIKDAS